MENKLESVILIKKSSKTEDLIHEEYTCDSKEVKLKLIPLVTPPRINIPKNFGSQLESFASPRNKPENILVAGVQAHNPQLNEEINMMRDIIEKQSQNLRKFKVHIRELKYDLIEAKDRELKWYGKFMNVQRSLAKNGSVIHMSSYKLDGNIDLESSLITIIEANEHLEEESKKVLQENKNLKEKIAETRLEHLELQRKFEKNYTLSLSLQKEVDFLRDRFKELHKTFLQRL